MKDTKNLKKKRDIEYPKLIKEAEGKHDQQTADYWRFQLKSVTEQIETRNKNRKKYNS